MFRFKLDIAGEVQLDRGIGRFADGVSDYRPIWPVIEDDFYAEEKAQFASEGAEGGEPWQALSPEYAGWKEAHYPGMPILQRTGDLERSLTSPSDPNAVKIEGRKLLTLGTRIPYAIYHQSIDPRTRLPRRPPIQLTAAFKTGVMRHLQSYLVQIATQVGFRAGLTPIQAAALSARSGGGAGIPPRRSLESRVRRADHAPAGYKRVSPRIGARA
ncbi:MAG TPA: phage virion morphogenesis protein [Acidobacteriaceae bacterium]|jgi:phage gpG-like protein|nr:phage virion morphogenesis protein [Acidobacteriaceae bacterium]